MRDRVEGPAESRGGQTETHAAVQEAYADADFYRSVFSQKGGTGRYWYQNGPGLGSDYRGQDDGMIIVGPEHPDTGIFVRDPMWDGLPLNNNAQTPYRDSSLTPRRGTLPGVNPNIYDPPVDPVNRPDQDSNYPQHTPEEPAPRNPEERWPGGGTMRVENEGESGELVAALDTAGDMSTDSAIGSDSSMIAESSVWDGADYASWDGGGWGGFDSGGGGGGGGSGGAHIYVDMC